MSANWAGGEMAGTGHLTPLAPGWSIWRTAALRGAGLPFDLLDVFTAPAGRPNAVGRLLREPAFLEALTWQNPAMVTNWVGRHAAALRQGTTPPLSAKRVAAVARYAQRYCAKNDTIGFFGPVAWATMAEDGTGVEVSGSGGLRRRSVYVETWVLRALADRWRAEPDLFSHLPVRLHPTIYFDGHRLHRPWRAPRAESEVARAVLGVAASGRMSVGALVAEAAARTGVTAVRVHAQVERLSAERVLDVGFVVPLNERPEQALAEQVAQVPDPEVCDRLQRDLDVLRDGVALVAAAGDPPRLHHALERLSHSVTTLTGQPGQRPKRASTTGRTCVYEDCRRDLDVRIGGDLVDQLRTPLRVLLVSARWLAAAVAAAVEEELRARYRDLCGRAEPVRLADLYFSAADVLSGSPGTVVHEVLRDFQLRWAELLGDGGGRERRVCGAEAMALSEAMFPGRTVPWSAARCHSPDLLLGRVGDRYQWVLGELHVALNTLESRVFHTQSDNRSDLVAAIGADMAAGRVVALPPVDSPEVSPRTYPPLAACPPGRYLYWSYGADAGPPDGAPCWPATALLVRESGGRLEVQPGDAAWRCPLVEVLGELLTALVTTRFRIMPPAPHTPRILIDDVVVCRETWLFESVELAGVGPANLAAYLVGHGVPRHAFVRTPVEPKPFYVDLDAPMLVRNLVRAIGLMRQRTGGAGMVEVTEMLPRPEHLWLRDAAGHRFTCELRTVAVDDSFVPVLPELTA